MVLLAQTQQGPRKVRVVVRLYATFSQNAPTSLAGDPFDVELPNEATLSDLIGQLGIPDADVHLSIVNGLIVHDRARPLDDGDRVALFPPVGGG
jgi:sulfur-carrier protein